jgi:threonine synthase
MKKTLIYSKLLSDKHKAKIYLKPEWLGETGSHKDVWAESIVKELSLGNIKKVVTMSSGNQGLALAAQCNRHGIECAIVAWDGIPRKYISLIEKYKAKLFVTKNSQQRVAVYKKFVKDGYFPCFLTQQERKSHEMPSSKAYKVISQQIFSDLGFIPDYVVVPTCYGDLASGLFAGFKQLGKIPKFILARAKDPAGDIAFSISTNLTSKSVVDVIKDSKGKSIYLQNDDFKKAKLFAKKHLKLNLEYSAAGPIEALNKLKKEEIAGKSIVLILTALER